MDAEVEERIKMFHRGSGCVRTPGFFVVAIVAVAMLAISAPAYAAVTEEDVPATSIVPESAPAGSPVAAPSLRPAGVVTPTATKPATHHRSTKASTRAPEVEPAQGRLQLIEDTWIYSEPAKSSKRIKRATKGKYVVVTGSTHYYLRVSLKDGQTGYLEPSAVAIVSPIDKVFTLTHDAGVLDKPNRWGKKLAEVHKGRNVHAVGLALNYMRIRMKSGLEGFIPISSLE